MRTLLLGLLLATTAAPAMAGPSDDEDRSARREAREERRAARSEAQEERRAVRQQSDEGSARAEHRAEPRAFERRIEPEPVGSKAVEHQAERRRFEDRVVPGTVQHADTDRPREERVEQMRRRGQGRRIEPVEVGGGGRQVTEGMQTPDSVRDWRRADRDRMRRPGGPKVVMPVPAGARPDIQAPRRREVTTAHYNPWRNNWRHDRRYDWRKYRERNRWRFNIGFYYDPFGWSYRRYPIGWRLWPSYYDSSFWLDDPWMYRLPPAYGPYRWVRYHNDALLVNIYSGQVVDVIYSFFW